jgi:D-hydroxyproline dehydrogenase subunit alpha
MPNLSPAHQSAPTPGSPTAAVAGAVAVDVLVVGAGPAGLAAAACAAEAGRDVAMLDQSPWLGGQIWRAETGTSGNRQARDWISRFQRSGAKFFASTTAFAAPSPQRLLAESPHGVLQITWQNLVLATGARELFLPFPGWTLPGVMGPGGLVRLSKNGWPVKGQRVVVAGTGPLLLAAAADLKRHGAHVSVVAEQAPWQSLLCFGLTLPRFPGKLAQSFAMAARLLGVRYRSGCWPIRADGPDQVHTVTLTDGSTTWTEPCDCLAVGFHLVPNIELAALLGCGVQHGRVVVDDLQQTTVPAVYCAGEPTGVGGADCALVEGEIAGWAAAGRPDHARTRSSARARWHRFRDQLHRAFALRPELRQLASLDTIVCRCEDIRRAQLELFTSWRAAKLHTRCGMGTCQGRTCGAATRFLFGWDNDSLRPPVLPVKIASLAAEN